MWCQIVANLYIYAVWEAFIYICWRMFRYSCTQFFRTCLQAEITELPVGIWNNKYKEKVLECVINNGLVK